MAKIGVSLLIDNVDYSRHSNRKLLALPLAVFALALLVLSASVVMTGAPVGLGVEFVGGNELRLADDNIDGDAEELITTGFSVQPDSVQTVPSDGTYIVTFKESETDISVQEAEAEEMGFEVRGSSEISPTFGSDTQTVAIWGILGAFGGMSLIVFGLFRTFVPSVAVVASAASDLLVPLAMMSAVGIDLTLGTVVALLLLIGYSVDSDILLNDYVVRRRGDFYESVYSAMDTGVTMTLTSFFAMVVMAAGAWVYGIPLLFQIGVILAFGLLVDLMNTYMMNVSLLRWYRFHGVKR